MDIARVCTVVLGGGRSQRMGFDKLAARFAGEPLARRVARGLLELEPWLVTTPAVAALVADLPGVSVIVTEPTAGISETLALAHAAIEAEAYLAVVPCDVPFVDARKVREFVMRVPAHVDLAWPVVGTTPGHPVVWSPKARALIPSLRVDEAPMRMRENTALHALGLDELDDAYVTDVDTPDAWTAASERAARGRRSSYP